MGRSNNDWLTCKLTKARLSTIDEIIYSNFDSTDLRFNDMVLYTLKKGGKRLRPSLYFLALNSGNYYDKELLHPAAALELIHIASLYHDDVMDRAELRRNVRSVNVQWGNVSATYSGNYIFSKAIAMLSDFDKKVNLISCQYISDLCLGQLKEAENAYNIHIDKDTHAEIIQNKTAALFELPCNLGGLLSRSTPEVTDALVSFGKYSGIAFQMIDDLLDLKGDPFKTGKAVATDLKEGVYTYATIHALEAEAHHGELSELLLLDNLTDEDLLRAIKIIQKRGGIEIARDQASQYIRSAIEQLSILPDGDSKCSLMNLAQFILQRDH